MTLEIYDADSLEFQVVVGINGTGEIKDLSNATVEASIALPNKPGIPAVCQILQPASEGRISVFYPEGTFQDKPGKYTCQVRVKEPGQRAQTVLVVRVNIRLAV